MRKKWTVVRVMATAQETEPAIYYPCGMWFWTKRGARKHCFDLEQLTYARGFATQLLDILHGTGWKVVSRKALGNMRAYSKQNG